MNNLANARLARRGMVGIAPLIKALPGTAAELSARTGVCISSAALYLRELRAVGLIHRCGWVSGLPRSTPQAIWALGSAEDVPGPRKVAKVRPRVNVINFAAMWRAIAEHALSASEIVEETGISLAAVRRTLSELRSLNLIYIREWRKMDAGPLTACWAVGSDKRNASKPRPKARKQVNADQVAKNRTRRQHLRLLAATSSNDAFARMAA